MRAVETNEAVNDSSVHFCREVDCAREQRQPQILVRRTSVVLQMQKVRWTAKHLLVTAVLSSIVAVVSGGDNQTAAEVFQSAFENFVKTQSLLTLLNDTLREVFNTTTTDFYYEHGI